MGLPTSWFIDGAGGYEMGFRVVRKICWQCVAGGWGKGRLVDDCGVFYVFM